MAVYSGESASLTEDFDTRSAKWKSSALLKQVLDHRGLAVCVFLHAAVVFFISDYFAITFDSIFRSRIDLLEIFTPAVVVAALLARLATAIVVYRPSRPLMWLSRDFAYSTLNGLCGIGLMILFIGNFSDFKSAIPSIHPFSWDGELATAGRLLHFGRHAWEWIVAIPGIEHVLPMLSFCYNIWVVVVFATLIYIAFSTDNRRLRLTFLYAFVLTWGIGGNLLATIFSSAGPVYMQRLGAGDEYQPLMIFLGGHMEGSTAMVRAVQEILWNQYISHASHLGGISAMPSLHVATAVLLALFGFNVHRLLGWVLSFYAILIMIGSVVLGWHYSVDGYVGAILAFLCWRLAIWLCRPGSWFGLSEAFNGSDGRMVSVRL